MRHELTSERYAALVTLAFYAGAASAFLNLPSPPPVIDKLFSVGDALLPFVAVLFYGALGIVLAYRQGCLLSVELFRPLEHLTDYSGAVSLPATDPYGFILKIALTWLFAVAAATAGFSLNRLRRAPEDAVVAWIAFTAILTVRACACLLTAVSRRA
jgi:hypothetical protein